MKRFLVVVLILALVIASGLLAGLFLAPERAQQTWAGLGLPAQGFDWLANLTSGATSGAGQPAPGSATLTASGFLEAEQTAIVAELSGQVLAVLVDEGEAVAAGQPLVRLDDSLLQAQMKQAEQGVAAAQAALDLAQAGPRPAELAAAQAQVQQAQATLDGAQQALLDAQAARADPQELLARSNAAEGRAALAQRQVEVQQARLAVLRVLRESIANDGSDQGQTQRAIYDQQQAAADETIAAAQAELQGAQRTLNLSAPDARQPGRADVQVRAAASQVRLAEEAVAVAEAGLALAAAGPQGEAVAVAAAQVAEAEAAREAVAAQLAKTTLASPVDGVVVLRGGRAGRDYRRRCAAAARGRSQPDDIDSLRAAGAHRPGAGRPASADPRRCLPWSRLRRRRVGHRGARRVHTQEHPGRRGAQRGRRCRHHHPPGRQPGRRTQAGHGRRRRAAGAVTR